MRVYLDRACRWWICEESAKMDSGDRMQCSWYYNIVMSKNEYLDLKKKKKKKKVGK